jgi:hypothetical protein
MRVSKIKCYDEKKEEGDVNLPKNLPHLIPPKSVQATELCFVTGGSICKTEDGRIAPVVGVDRVLAAFLGGHDGSCWGTRQWKDGLCGCVARAGG